MPTSNLYEPIQAWGILVLIFVFVLGLLLSVRVVAWKALLTALAFALIWGGYEAFALKKRD